MRAALLLILEDFFSMVGCPLTFLFLSIGMYEAIAVIAHQQYIS
jgi:hypothetical protein